jgi:hypothetical protein
VKRKRPVFHARVPGDPALLRQAEGGQGARLRSASLTWLPAPYRRPQAPGEHAAQGPRRPPAGPNANRPWRYFLFAEAAALHPNQPRTPVRECVPIELSRRSRHGRLRHEPAGWRSPKASNRLASTPVSQACDPKVQKPLRQAVAPRGVEMGAGFIENEHRRSAANRARSRRPERERGLSTSAFCSPVEQSAAAWSLARWRAVSSVRCGPVSDRPAAPSRRRASAGLDEKLLDIARRLTGGEPGFQHPFQRQIGFGEGRIRPGIDFRLQA